MEKCYKNINLEDTIAWSQEGSQHAVTCEWYRDQEGVFNPMTNLVLILHIGQGQMRIVINRMIYSINFKDFFQHVREQLKSS